MPFRLDLNCTIKFYGTFVGDAAYLVLVQPQVQQIFSNAHNVPGTIPGSWGLAVNKKQTKTTALRLSLFSLFFCFKCP